MRRKRRSHRGEVNLILMMITFVIIIVSIIAGIIKESGRNRLDESQNTESNESSERLESGEEETLSDDAKLDKENVKKEITALVRQYRAACAIADVESIAKLYNIDVVQNASTFEGIAKIITGYQNTECHIMEGMDESSRVVFIYDDLKLEGFDTLVPNISYIYVKAKANGSFYIDPGTFNEETMLYEYSDEVEDFISNLKGSAEISSLIRNANEAFLQACNQDEKLEAYFEKLIAASKNKNIQKAEEKTQQTKESIQ